MRGSVVATSVPGMRTIPALGAATLLLVSAASTASAAPVRYFVRDLGTLGGDSSQARGINASGQVVGTSKNVHGVSRAFRVPAGNVIDRHRDLLAMPTDARMPGTPEQSFATGIADDGTVAGFTTDERGGAWPVLWRGSTAMSAFGGSGRVFGIAPNGDAVGHAYHFSSASSRMVSSPFLRRADGTTSFLELFDGHSVATGVSRAGVVGDFRVSTHADSRALLWRGADDFDDLGSFGSGTYRTARAIDATGRWVGMVASGASVTAYSGVVGGGAAAPLPQLARSTASDAYGVSDAGHIVGMNRPDGFHTAVMWHVGPTSTELVDLNQRKVGFTGTIVEAFGVNVEGEIAADAIVGGASRAVVLAPDRLRIGGPGAPDAGHAYTYTISGCEPGARVQLYWSTGDAGGPVWRAMGVKVDIHSPDSFGPQVYADSAGVARVSVVTPRLVQLYLQAVQRGNKSFVFRVRPRIPFSKPIAGPLPKKIPFGIK
jgi:probable HAF family extracellular repeat protein